MIILYVILSVWLLAWLAPKLLRWFLRYSARKMQKQMFRQMGIDPDMFNQSAPREEERRGRTQRPGSAYRRRRAGYSSPRRIIPPEYAETVQFEALALSGHEAWLDSAGSPVFTEYRYESQISDAEWSAC
ncbi:MAG: hypothetical protein J6L73_06350 [Muribaculaceae bacterium]|nr:hypothetical protein [Muribaculaceae bacterium]